MGRKKREGEGQGKGQLQARLFKLGPAWTKYHFLFFGEPRQSDHFGLGRGNQHLKTCKESVRIRTSIIEWVCEVRDKKTLHGSIGYEGITVNKKYYNVDRER